MEIGEVKMFDRLSAPLNLTCDFDESLILAFDYFNKTFDNSNRRPNLFGKDIFIEKHEIISGWPAGFWHIVSIEDNHHFRVLPCSNDINIDLCKENCNKNVHQIKIKNGVETRNICLLRASRLPWIIDIINLANQKDPLIKIWLKPGNGPSNGKLYLRYQHNGADYIVIFSAEKRFYRLISAFPVFYVNEKEAFAKDYITYVWSFTG
ncbi:MAG: hypothetical protein Q8876_03675 [Bacillota bacterium]|nr:hypothetical protein [Bacillota bacterium]